MRKTAIYYHIFVINYFVFVIVNKKGYENMKSVISENQSWIDATWEKVEKKLSKTAIKSRNKIPYTTVNGEHDGKAGISHISPGAVPCTNIVPGNIVSGE